ncbi:MAG: response regulator [Anaerolineae bacterium]|nr:response regulator [Anaerolineae bacterium]
MSNLPLALLVEDSPTQAIEITAALKQSGFDVIMATDGLSALDMVYEHQPVLVVLDVQLPKMNGYQVCHRLKRNPQTASIPVIMMTIADSSEATLAGLEAGADDYIAKDVFAAENLITTLNSFKMRMDGRHAKE